MFKTNINRVPERRDSRPSFRDDLMTGFRGSYFAGEFFPDIFSAGTGETNFSNGFTSIISSHKMGQIGLAIDGIMNPFGPNGKLVWLLLARYFYYIYREIDQSRKGEQNIEQGIPLDLPKTLRDLLFGLRYSLKKMMHQVSV